MIPFPGNILAAGFGLVLSVACGCAVSAAQEPASPEAAPGPVPLVPRMEAAPLDIQTYAPPRDMPLFPAGKADPGDPGDPVRQMAPRPGAPESGIQVGRLGQVDEASVGLYDNEREGLGSRMWAGTDRLVVERRLRELPGASPLPSLATLQRKLLLTSAQPPQGSTEGHSLLTLRVLQLLEMGEAEAVRALFSRAGNPELRPESAKARAEAYLAGNDIDRACQSLAFLPVGKDIVENALARFSLQLSALCQAHAGEKSAAGLTADLAREQGLDTPVFYALLGEVTEELFLPAKTPSTLDPLLFALYGKAGRGLPASVLEHTPVFLYPGIARSTTMPLPVRIQAAEKALFFQLVDSDELGALYNQVDLKGNPAAYLSDNTPWRRRAAFVQAAYGEPAPEARAAILDKAFSGSLSAEDHRILGKILAPALISVPPSPAHADPGPRFIRVLVTLRDRPRASMWTSMLAEQGLASDEIRELEALTRLLALREGGNAHTGLLVQELWQDITAGKAPQRARATTTAFVLDALGVSLDSRIWTALTDGETVPDEFFPSPGLMRALENAARAGRRGEVVILTLAGIGAQPPGRLNVQALATMVSSLRQVGLETEAFDLAFDALLARSHAGLPSGL